MSLIGPYIKHEYRRRDKVGKNGGEEGKQAGVTNKIGCRPEVG